ncbi:hypothetical protein [Okeania sp. SIO2B3]|nr:hypothetical protein [Okeania sp. SIO2B3]NET44587.1 hypothetical protein [Okeania sp. SIO2B3]
MISCPVASVLHREGQEEGRSRGEQQFTSQYDGRYFSNLYTQTIPTDMI